MEYVEQALRVMTRLRERMGARAFYGVAVGMLVLLVCAGAYAALRPHAVPLFATPLAQEQVAEIDARLSAWGVAHDVTIDGVTVDAARRDEIVVRLSMNGLPHQHVATSEETLAKLNALTPEAVFAAQSRAGLEGDLAVALRAVDGIRDASIVIAPAVAAPFSDTPASPASASVRLTMRPGTIPTQGMIDGVRAFIAGGVPGLDRARITLLDDRGIALSADPAPRGARPSTADPTTALQSAFDEAFGRGAVLVRVHIAYDQASRDTREIRRSVLAGAPLRENEHREHLHGSERNYDRVDRENERGSITREERSHLPAGAATHVAVALFVDAERKLDVERLRTLAAATAGLDLAHGDTIVVEPLPFAKDAPTPARVLGDALRGAMPYANCALWLGVVLAGCLARARLERGARRIATHCAKLHARRDATAGDAQAGEIHASLRAEPIYTTAAVLTSLPTPLREAVLARYSPDEREALHRRMRAPITHYAVDR